MKTSLKYLTLTIIIIAGLGLTCYANDNSESSESTKDLTDKIIQKFTNNDIEWYASPFGVRGSLQDEENIFENNKRKLDYSIVYKYLDDKKRFAVAHYFLAYGTLTKHTLNASSWNGLKVSIGAKTTIPEDQIPDLKEMWKQYKPKDKEKSI
jgi:hypothetical protein